MRQLWILICLLALSSCQGPPPSVDEDLQPRVTSEPPAWSIAIHGGAGTLDRDMPEERKAAYLEALEDALDLGSRLLEEGSDGLDVVETVIRQLEDEPLFNAGRGAVKGADLEPIDHVERELVSPDGKVVKVRVPVYPPFRLESRPVPKAPPRRSPGRKRKTG